MSAKPNITNISNTYDNIVDAVDRFIKLLAFNNASKLDAGQKSDITDSDRYPFEYAG